MTVPVKLNKLVGSDDYTLEINAPLNSNVAASSVSSGNSFIVNGTSFIICQPKFNVTIPDYPIAIDNLPAEAHISTQTISGRNGVSLMFPIPSSIVGASAPHLRLELFGGLMSNILYTTDRYQPNYTSPIEQLYPYSARSSLRDRVLWQITIER